MQTKMLLLITALSLVANGFLGFGALKELGGTPQEQFPYLSKRIFVEDQNDIVINFVPLRTAMSDYVEKLDNPVGVYFEYLPSGISVGINEKDEYVIASLLKVPLVMAAYSQINKGELSLEQILVVEDRDLEPTFGDLWKRGAGTRITIEEAIRLILTESDNTAKNVLLHAVHPRLVEDILDYLDIPPSFEGQKLVITTKNYSSILRSLYLSSYLPFEYSNKILETLTHSKFNDKLTADIPSAIKVAHKIGVYEVENNTVYSDCGIIYAPQRPYLLCLMVNNAPEVKATEYMRHVSKMVYGYVVRATIR